MNMDSWLQQLVLSLQAGSEMACSKFSQSKDEAMQLDPKSALKSTKV